MLGLLHDAPMHGYELRKQVNLVLGRTRLLSYGSLYPALKRMLRDGWLRQQSEHPGGRRIVYELTPAGQREFARLVADVGPEAWDDDTFDVRFAFFARTDTESRLRVLEGRRARLQERLGRVQDQLDRTQRQLDHYALELRRHGVESDEREVRWLSDLIHAEQAPRRPVTNGTRAMAQVEQMEQTDQVEEMIRWAASE